MIQAPLCFHDTWLVGMELNEGGEGFTDPQAAARIDQVELGDAYEGSVGSGRAGQCAWDKGIGWGTTRCGGELQEGNDGQIFSTTGPMYRAGSGSKHCS